MQQGWGPWAGVVTGVLAFVVCYATIHTYLAGFSRLVYAQAREGYFPRFFAVLHGRFQVPHRVFLVLAPVFLDVLLIYLWRGLDLGVLIQWPSAIFIALYIIGMAAAARLLRDNAVLCSLAVIALVMCAAVYGFLGWVGLYPVGLGALGLSVHVFGRRLSSTRNRPA
jgi:amino acid efflux transporter